MTRNLAILLGLACLTSAGCNASSLVDGGDFVPGTDCFTVDDCGAGLECVDFKCVSVDDGEPPEVEEPRTFLRPVATETAVFALAPEADLVTRVDPTSLALEAIRLPDEPVALALVPGTESAVIVSRAGRAVSWLGRVDGRTMLHSQDVARHYSNVDVTPDGKFALLWTREGEPLDAGTEGLVSVIDLVKLRAGQSQEPRERASGRRLTNVVFRNSGLLTLDAIIVGKSEFAVLDLGTLDTVAVPQRIPIPDAYADLSVREAAAPPNATFVLLRSLASAELAVFDVATRTLSTLTLPAAPTDLDLTPDGSFAVAVLRSVSKVAWFPLPATLTDATLIRTADVTLPAIDCDDSAPCLASPGQAELSPDGTFAALFTSARDVEAFTTVTFATGTTRTYTSLKKKLRTLGISPDSTRVLAVHLPQPNSTVADNYEREVDKAQGYSLVDLDQGFAQLKLTGDVPPQEFVFASSGRFATVTLRDDVRKSYVADAIDLSSLVVTPLALASAPQFAGAFPGTPGNDRAWITQVHAAGRISFLDLSTRSVRTATGYELNSEIER